MIDQLSALNWQAFWQPHELVLIRPPFLWELMWWYVGFIALCALGGISLLFLSNVHPALKSRLSSFCWTNVTIGVILFFFRYYRIPYLGMDILRLLQEVSALVWLGYLVWYSQTGFKHQLIQEKVADHKARYLPKSR